MHNLSLSELIDKYKWSNQDFIFIQNLLSINDNRIKPITLRWYLPYGFHACDTFCRDLELNNLATIVDDKTILNKPDINPRGFGS